GRGDWYIATDDYEAVENDQVSVSKGQKLEVVDSNVSDSLHWIMVSAVNESGETHRGLVPRSIVFGNESGASSNKSLICLHGVFIGFAHRLLHSAVCGRKLIDTSSLLESVDIRSHTVDPNVKNMPQNHGKTDEKSSLKQRWSFGLHRHWFSNSTKHSSQKSCSGNSAESSNTFLIAPARTTLGTVLRGWLQLLILMCFIRL
uniref:SH3 domain-containing protein n=1 Tax=Syphacia muris TaxID=451379 RepID=A0A0N5AX48_9BILA